MEDIGHMEVEVKMCRGHQAVIGINIICITVLYSYLNIYMSVLIAAVQKEYFFSSIPDEADHFVFNCIHHVQS